MAKKYQRITLNFFLDTDQELDISEISRIFKRSSDSQHDNLNVYSDGEYGLVADIYAMDFQDPAHSRVAVKQLFDLISERL